MTKKWFVTLLVMLFIFQGMAVFASAPGNPADETEVPKKALKLVNKADKALMDKKYDKALDGYNKAIEIAPEYAAAYYGIGRVQVEQKKYSDAIVNLEKAVTLAPDAPDAKKLLGSVLLEMGKGSISQRQFKAANDYLLKIVDITGIDTLDARLYRETLFQIALNYARLKNFAKSNEYFKKIVALPGIEEADKNLVMQTLYQVGINYYNLQKPKESNEYFLKLLEYPEAETAFPQVYISMYYLIGLNANMLKDYDKSIEYLVKFLELGETSSAHSQLLPLANYLLGSTHMSLLQKEADKILHDKDQKGKKEKIAQLAKKKKNIETYLKKAIQLQDSLEMAYMHLGNYYYYCNELDKAIEIYQKLVEKFPSSPDLDVYKQFLENIEKEKQDKK